MSQRKVSLVAHLAGGHGGVPRYAASLAGALDEVSSEFPGLRMSVLTTKTGAGAIGARSLDVRILRVDSNRLNRGIGRIAAEQWTAHADDSDLLHFFDLAGPVFAPRRPFVATVHDLSLMHGFTRIRRAHKRWLIPWAARHATAVVAISQFAKDELVGRLSVDPANVSVIRSGPGLLAGSDGGATRTAQEEPRDPYLLYVGDLTASKNLPMLIRAFDRIEVPARLLLVGRPLERYGEIVEAIQAAKHGSRIELRHDVGDDELERLYANAAALVLPSLYEGFGLTALEAMQRGCPVLESDIPALREISGDGAELLRPEDEQAWADAMGRVLTDDSYRRALRERGRATVDGYSWQRTARELCLLFERVPLR